ncbi:MAG: hypothetical protein Q8N53_00855 [Longimicrobiales bacterium]|nr:hypothetical protein [Longimicrobiales bacterium]
MTISVEGLHVGFRLDGPGVFDRVCDRLPPGWKPSDRVEVRRLYSLRVGGEGKRRGHHLYHVLYMNASRIERSMDLEYILDRLEADVQLYVAERARRRIFVHAGVVGWQSKAILLPGRTLTGKTTLVTELLRLGATYYSDEYAALDPKGRVHPYARPLSVRRGATDPRPARQTAEEFGAEAGHKPLPVGLVAFTQYKPGVRWRPRGLTAGQGILSLLENAVPARSRPKACLATFREVVSAARVLKGARGEAREMAEALLARVE